MKHLLMIAGCGQDYNLKMHDKGLMSKLYYLRIDDYQRNWEVFIAAWPEDLPPSVQVKSILPDIEKHDSGRSERQTV
jgi:hypothetical protein